LNQNNSPADYIKRLENRYDYPQEYKVSYKAKKIEEQISFKMIDSENKLLHF